MVTRQLMTRAALALGIAGLVPWFANAADPAALAARGPGKVPVTRGGESCPPNIVGCPEDFDVNAAPGECTASAQWEPPAAVPGTCQSPVDSFVSDHNPGDSLPVGTTLVTYTAQSGGFQSSCSFLVTVHGDTPVISCPPEVWTVHCNDPAGYRYTPVVTPPCDNGQVIVTGDGDPFPFGTTEGVTVTVMDANGQESNTCTFTLVVLGDVQEPVRVQSNASRDGTVRQRRVGVQEGSYATSTMNSIQVGDDGNNLESRGILSFDLSNNPVPEGAVITEATIRLTRVGQQGHPEALGGIVADLATPSFGGAGLESSDFEATETQHDAAGFVSAPPAGGSSCIFAGLTHGYLPMLNRAGLNQFRIHSINGVSMNRTTDMYSFASGEAANAPLTRPELIIEYYFPECPTCGAGSEPGPETGSVTLTSQARNDGYIKEGHWSSNVGYFALTTAATINVGDTTSREQMIGLLSFDTSSIPADAAITSARLRLVRTGSTGSPGSLGALAVDMRCDGGIYGALPGVEPTDFQAYSYLSGVGGFSPLPTTNNGPTWAVLNEAGRTAIRRGEGAVTQFKVHFTQPDNGNAIADYMIFGSGDGGINARPQLVVDYTYGAERAASAPAVPGQGTGLHHDQ